MNIPIRVSIITVCYNAEKCILETLKSVSEQTYENIEYIIIDGKSQDSTLSIVREYFSDKQCNVRIIYEPDSGIYDAMNKGISLATGDWVNFMNAGDKFATNDIIADIFGAGTPTCDVLYGDTIYYSDGFYKLVKSKAIDFIKERMPFCHQSVFTKKIVLQKYVFDTEYRICADWDLFIKLYNAGYLFKNIDKVVSIYELGGESAKSISRYIDEKYRICRTHSKGNIKINRRKEFIYAYLSRFSRRFLKRIYYSEKRGWSRSV